MVVIMQNAKEKVNLWETKNTPQTQERFVWKEMNFAQGKNGGHAPSSLGSRSIFVVSQSGEGQVGRQNSSSFQISKIDNFSSKACSVFWNGFIVLIALYQ